MYLDTAGREAEYTTRPSTPATLHCQRLVGSSLKDSKAHLPQSLHHLTEHRNELQQTSVHTQFLPSSIGQRAHHSGLISCKEFLRH